MREFNEYFLMNENDVIDYIKCKTDFFEEAEVLESKEIGDGNLNYVYRVSNGEKSVILKQAGSFARLSSGREISKDRNRIESEILMVQEELASEFTPKVHFYDEIMCCCVMEDLKGYKIMRTAILEGDIYPLFSEHISEFLVNMLFKTSDLKKDHKSKKESVRRFINPDLCEISERLVFDEAMINMSGKNSVEEENIDFVSNNVYKNKNLILEVAKLKFYFMNNPEVLIHGDLHTGSIFINDKNTKIFDPEFAFYGPISYDIGNVVGNLIMTLERKKADEDNCSIDWLKLEIPNIINKFILKFNEFYDSQVEDALALQDGFKEWYLGEVLKYTAAFAGTEMIRRTIGVAKVKDISEIEDIVKKAEAQRNIILMGIKLIMDKEEFVSVEAYKSIIG